MCLKATQFIQPIMSWNEHVHVTNDFPHQTSLQQAGYHRDSDIDRARLLGQKIDETMNVALPTRTTEGITCTQISAKS